MGISIKTVCVCGAGTMGSGIAQVCAASGYPTLLFDLDIEVLQKAQYTLEEGLQKLVNKEKISAEEKKQTIQNLQYSSDSSNCIADLVIEAIVEKLGAKHDLFRQLFLINKEQTIFASNTSSLSITGIAGELGHPKNLIGLHFFNPAPLMKLVEVIKTPYTSNEIISTAISFIKSINKIPVVCKDSPGFIVNRVARPYYIESLRLIEEGVATIKTVDKLLESQGFKMGPFKLMDLIGNDINYAVSCSVYEQLNKPARLKPSVIQKEKVEKKELGKKTGKGYYSY